MLADSTLQSIVIFASLGITIGIFKAHDFLAELNDEIAVRDSQKIFTDEYPVLLIKTILYYGEII